MELSQTKRGWRGRLASFWGEKLQRQVLIIWWMLVCFLGWGVSAFLMGYVGQAVDFQTSLFWNTVGMMVGTIPVLPKITLQPCSMIVFWGVLSGVLYSLADIGFYNAAMMGVSVSVLGPASALYIVVPAVLGVLLLKEPITGRKAAGIVLAIVAIALLTQDEGESVDPGDTELAAHKSNLVSSDYHNHR